MKRFSFQRPVEPPSIKPHVAVQLKATFGVVQSGLPQQLSRRDAKEYLHRALQDARHDSPTLSSLDSVADVIEHAAKYGSVKHILIQAGIAQTLMTFLQRVLLHVNEAMALKVLAVVQLLLMDSTFPAVAAGRIEEHFALDCLKHGLNEYIFTLIEGFIDKRSVLISVSEVIKWLLKVGLRARKVVLASGIIRLTTNRILENTNRVDAVLILGGMLRFLMSYSSGYRRDHAMALQEASAAMEIHVGNVHVGRIVSILMSQRKWGRSEWINSNPCSCSQAIEVALSSLLQWRRDECIVRCSLRTMTYILQSLDSSPIMDEAISILFNKEICETCIELLYHYRKKHNAVIDIINFVSLIDTIITAQGTSCTTKSKNNIAFSCDAQVEPSLVLSIKMRLNEMSMNYRWQMRKGFCCFLAQYGYIKSPRVQVHSSILCDPAALRGDRACLSSHSDGVHNEDHVSVVENDIIVIPYPVLSPILNEVFSSRHICVCISSFI